jgi:NuA3 HAT complex component NTO1
VCAQWVPGVRVARLGACAVVEGVAGLPQERWGVPCSLCGSSMGVVLRCNAGHCSLPFHALCARNAGLYLAVRGDPGKPASSYRAYCAQHSAAQRRKDAEVSGEVCPAP